MAKGSLTRIVPIFFVGCAVRRLAATMAAGIVGIASLANAADGGDRAPPSGWQLADLASTVQSLRGRSYERGRELFVKAHCASCHPADAKKEFGPDLTKLDPRFQPVDILRDVLEPSRRIADARYEVWMFELASGRELVGLVASETMETLKLMQQPPSVAPPLEIPRGEIERRKMSLISIMPERLLDGLTRDEVADLIAYVAARGEPPEPPATPATD